MRPALLKLKLPLPNACSAYPLSISQIPKHGPTLALSRLPSPAGLATPIAAVYLTQITTRTTQNTVCCPFPSGPTHATHTQPDGPEDDSPYPEVRSAVASTDDPEMPVSTLRAWVLGILFAVLIPGMNQFFYFRYPSVSITGVSAPRPVQLLHQTHLPGLARRATSCLPRRPPYGSNIA